MVRLKVDPGTVPTAPRGVFDRKPEPRKAGFFVSDFVVVVDSRESTPWTFSGITGDASEKYQPILVQTKVAGLPTGDYSIEGFEGRFVLERKSLSDLYSTIGGGRDRFRAEHERMEEIVRGGGFAEVIVEASLQEVLESPPLNSRLRPESVLGVAESWSMRYRVTWTWAGSRRLAELWAFKRMRRFWEKANEQ